MIKQISIECNALRKCLSEARLSGLILIFSLCVSLPVHAALNFMDFTTQSGLVSTHGISGRTWDVAVGDVNGDSINDIYAMGHAQGPDQPNLSHLFASSSNLMLTNITSGMVERGGGQAALLTDLDADGDLDLLTSSNDGVGAVFRNTGAGAFEWFGTDFPGSEYQLDGREMARGDIEGDGDLDLIIGSHTRDMQIFYNNGNNVYSKIPFDSVLQRGDDRAVTLQIFTDIDKDGDMDIVSQRTSEWTADWPPNLPITVDLWLNNGSGNFTWVSDSRGLMGGTEEAPLVIGDFDNDADLDIVQLASAARGGVRFFENDPLGYFTENAASRGFAGLPKPSGVDWWAKSSVGDLDNDGDLDIINNGKQVYVNNGNGVFTYEELPVTFNGRITRVADLDNDGDLDVAGANVHWDPPLDGYYLHRNNTNGNNWLVVRVDAGAKNPFGVGAKVTVSAGGQLLGYREITNASAMHQALEAHFGLGGCNCNSVTIEVVFPDDSVTTIPNVKLGQKLVVTTAGAIANKIFSDGFE